MAQDGGRERAGVLAAHTARSMLGCNSALIQGMSAFFPHTIYPDIGDREMFKNVNITATFVLIEHDRKTVISN